MPEPIVISVTIENLTEFTAALETLQEALEQLSRAYKELSVEHTTASTQEV